VHIRIGTHCALNRRMRFCFRQVLSQALEPTDGPITIEQDFLLGEKENPRSTVSVKPDASGEEAAEASLR